MKNRLYEIIFEADTRTGKLFDIIILIFIVLSILAVMLESVRSIRESYGNELLLIEWIITSIFTIEYILRATVVKKPLSYMLSFFGIIDLLSILPSFLGLFFIGTHGLLVLRVLLLLRIFRIFKITRYINAGEVIVQALKDSRAKISVFLFGVLTIVIILGTLMYLIEGEQNGFTSIPKSIYWAIVTMTTVGYGDITPLTTIGQFLAGFMMILGYSIIAVPTGIITVEMVKKKTHTTQVCPSCLKEGHDINAIFCKYCGEELNPEEKNAT